MHYRDVFLVVIVQIKPHRTLWIGAAQESGRCNNHLCNIFFIEHHCSTQPEVVQILANYESLSFGPGDNTPPRAGLRHKIIIMYTTTFSPVHPKVPLGSDDFTIALADIPRMFDFSHVDPQRGLDKIERAGFPKPLGRYMQHSIHIIYCDGSRRPPETRHVSLRAGITCAAAEALLNLGGVVRFALAGGFTIDSTYLGHQPLPMHLPFLYVVQGYLTAYVHRAADRFERVVQVLPSAPSYNVFPPLLLPECRVNEEDVGIVLEPYLGKLPRGTIAVSKRNDPDIRCSIRDKKVLRNKPSWYKVLDAPEEAAIEMWKVERAVVEHLRRHVLKDNLFDTFLNTYHQRYGGIFLIMDNQPIDTIHDVFYNPETATLTIEHTIHLLSDFGTAHIDPENGCRRLCFDHGLRWIRYVSSNFLCFLFHVGHVLFYVLDCRSRCKDWSDDPTEASHLQERRYLLDNCLAPSSTYAAAIPSVSVPLFEHQRRSLQFMVEREIETVRDRAGVHESFKYFGYGRIATSSQIPSHKKGGILADALGLGKTVTSLALVAVRPAPTLIVCTPSVLGQWQREISEKTALECEAFDSKNPTPTKDLVLITYTMLARHPELLGRFPRLILDEAHTMSEAFVEKVAKDAEIVWCLSATPVKNLGRQLAALIGTTAATFKDRVYTNELMTWLMDRLVCRHTHHSAVALPAVEERVVEVAPNSEELVRYAKSLDRATSLAVNGHRRVNLSILMHTRRYLSSGLWRSLASSLGEEATQQQEAPEDDVCPVCIDVYQDPVMTQCKHWFCRDCLNLVRRRSTAKCPMCRQAIGRVVSGKRKSPDTEEEDQDDDDDEEEEYNEGSKALAALANLGTKTIIFSEFRDTLKNLRTVLTQNDIGVRMVLGSDDAQKRANTFHAFQNDPECHVLLLTTRATSAGVSLPAADTVIFMEPCLSPSAHEQAIGRAVRLGNVASTVNVVNLVAENTIEQDLFRYVKEHNKQPTHEAIKNFLGI